MALVRLQKYLADKGVASRRKCEEYIAQGMVKVNGKVVTEMGTKVDPEKDTIDVSPELKMQEQKNVYLMLNKPAGYVCSVTGPEEPKIMELVKDIPERIFPVGRLDKESSGLILMTNDGRFAYHMTHPKFEKEKEYEVTVFKKISDEALQKMRDGMNILDKRTQPTEVTRLGPNQFRIILREGMNRQIRRMCRKLKHQVKTLKRIRIGTLLLHKMRPGEFKFLTSQELKEKLQYKL